MWDKTKTNETTNQAVFVDPWKHTKVTRDKPCTNLVLIHLITFWKFRIEASVKIVYCNYCWFTLPRKIRCWSRTKLLIFSWEFCQIKEMNGKSPIIDISLGKPKFVIFNIIVPIKPLWPKTRQVWLWWAPKIQQKALV